jgi:hypothetical protein
VPDEYHLSRFFQVDTDIIGYPRVSLRVLIELVLAPGAAEMIFQVFMGAGIFRIFFINYHQTYRIGTHG